MQKKYITILICLLIVVFSSNCFASDDFCKVAKDIENKAVATFKNDMEKGLKLFLKAVQMCDSKDMKYNLGIAFYSYGNTLEAQKYLEQAVDKTDTNPVRLNNLASVLLANRTSQNLAIELARKSVKLNKNFKQGYDTLTDALFATGKRLEALKIINAAVKKFSGTKYLEQKEQKIIKQYILYYLSLIKSGSINAGLAGLEKADFEQSVALSFCSVLEKLGQDEKALQKTAFYKTQFYANKDFAKLYNKIISKQVQNFYTLFKSGQEKSAMSLAKSFSEKYPQNPDAVKAYNDLFNAFIGGTETIEIPAAMTAQAQSQDYNDNTGVGSVLDSIGLNTNQPVQDLNLNIDVDSNIPKGRKKNKFAIALLIGNQKYAIEQKGLPDVKYAQRDVAVMAKYLETTMGYSKDNIIKRTNITSGDFRTLLGTAENPGGVLQDYIRSGKSDVFVYYVGHGSPGPTGKSAYLVPVDAQTDYIKNTGYPLSLFYSIMENLDAKSKTIVLDACFSGDSVSGSLFKNISPAMLKTVTPAQNIPNAALFCAADKDQVATWYPAKRHSLFSYFFFKGLQGKADINKDKIIRLSELEAYIKDEVRYRAKRESGRTQTPLVTGAKDIIIAELE